jgi:hypothetical protein
MDIKLKTSEEVSQQYAEMVKFIEENIAIFSNTQLANVRNYSFSLLHSTIKQSEQNLENLMETNNANLDAYQKLTKTMKLNSEKNSNRDVVTLNVGGRLFSTFKETLMRFEYSYFYGLLSSGQELDRNPLKAKLHRLALGIISITETSTSHILNLEITKSSGGACFNCPVIGSSPVSEFSVQIISGVHINIGFCPIDKFKQNISIFNQLMFAASIPLPVLFGKMEINLSLTVPHFNRMIN